MSDQSDTSSINGDWEPINDSQDLEHDMEKLRDEMKIMKMEMEKKDAMIAQLKLEMESKKNELKENHEEIEKKARENLEKNMEIEKKNSEVKALRETAEAKDKEIKELRSKKEAESTVSLDEWMKVQVESVKLSSVNLKNKSMELYQKISKQELAKAQATSSSERKQRAKEIQTMEDLCEQISKAIVMKNIKCVSQITNLLNSVGSGSQRDSHSEAASKQENNEAISKDLPIGNFLGEFTAVENASMSPLIFGNETLPLRTFIIRKAKLEGYFEVCWRSDSGEETVSLMWTPDNVVRSGWRYRIEKNVLVRESSSCAFLCFVHSEEGITFNGSYSYARI